MRSIFRHLDLIFRRLAPWLVLAAPALVGCGEALRSPVESATDQNAARPTEPGHASPAAIISRSRGKLEFLSPVYKIDKLYPSMTGPWSSEKVILLDPPRPESPPELLWITGCRVEMVDAEAQQPISPLFMCHVNLDLDIEQHKQRFSLKSFRDERLFTLSQGQLATRFPPGFGVPIRSDEPVDVSTQVLNLNWPDKTFNVRHHVTIEFVRQCDVTSPMQPLYECGVVGLVSLEDHEVAFDANELMGGDKCVSCCAPGKKAVEWAEGLDSYSRRFSNHWVVKPGRHEYRTRATSTLSLNTDTTIHYIAVHLHPYAESVELRDLTTGESLFTSRARHSTKEIGLDHVDSFSSAAGLPVYRSHEYELLTTYNNTTDVDQDAMAVMYAYVLDKEYRQPRLPGDATPSQPAAGDTAPATDKTLKAPAAGASQPAEPDASRSVSVVPVN